MMKEIEIGWGGHRAVTQYKNYFAFVVEIISDKESRHSHAELLVSPLHAHRPAVPLAQDALQYPSKINTGAVVLVDHVRDDGVHQTPHHVVVHCSEIEKKTT